MTRLIHERPMDRVGNDFSGMSTERMKPSVVFNSFILTGSYQLHAVRHTTGSSWSDFPRMWPNGPVTMDDNVAPHAISAARINSLAMHQLVRSTISQEAAIVFIPEMFHPS